METLIHHNPLDASPPPLHTLAAQADMYAPLALPPLTA